MVVVPLLVLAIAVFILIPFDSDVTIGDFHPTPYTGKINPGSNYTIQDHYFPTAEEGISCHAWLYLPLVDTNNGTLLTAKTNETTHNSTLEARYNGDCPVIIMAGGMAEQKDFGLDVYAEEFVKKGFCVFLFDYRNFGASQGRPRNLVSPKRHVEDWHSAIGYIHHNQTIQNIVNPNKIGLWGMSFAGGHVLTVTSQLQQEGKRDISGIVGVVAQAPFLKPGASTKRSSKKRGKLGKLRLVFAAYQDAARGRLGLAPAVIRILGVRGQLAMMPTSPEAYKAYESLRPVNKLGGWINRGPVRGLFELKNYVPLETVRKSPPQMPVLLISGTRDKVCPSNVIAELHDILPQSRIVTRNATHVDIMGPDHAPEVGAEMAKFYAEAFR